MQPGGFKGWMGEGTNRQDLGAFLRYAGSAMNSRPNREGLQNYMLAKQMKAGRAEGQQLINDILQKKSPGFTHLAQPPSTPPVDPRPELRMTDYQPPFPNQTSVSADLIKGFEGYRDNPYYDVNAYRSGYGSDTTTAADGTVSPVVQGVATDRASAERDLRRRIETEFTPMAKAAAGASWSSYSPEQRAALTSIAYNYGEIPDRIKGAVSSGDHLSVANAIAGLAGDNAGVNKPRRMGEAGAFGTQMPQTETGMSDARLAQVLGHPGIDPNVKQMMLARYQAQGGAQFRPATSEEAARYGAESGQIDTKTGRFHETKKAPKTEVNVDLSKGDLSPMWEAIDKDFASQYTKWVGGGGSDAKALIANIGGVLEKLEQGKPLTGALVGTMPDFVRAFTHPEAQDAKDRVESVVQRSMRETLGAQFTEQEGERLIARAYNPVLRPEMNAARLRSLFTVMESAAAAKDAMVDHANEHGTLRGYEGPRMPTVSDFDAALDAASITPTQSVAPDAIPGPYGVSFGLNGLVIA